MSLKAEETSFDQNLMAKSKKRMGIDWLSYEPDLQLMNFMGGQNYIATNYSFVNQSIIAYYNILKSSKTF